MYRVFTLKVYFKLHQSVQNQISGTDNNFVSDSQFQILKSHVWSTCFCCEVVRFKTEYLTAVNEYRPQLTIKRHWKVQLTINIIIWSIS